MSAGSSANKSSTRTIPPAFSRNMISSPRRKISTSELLTLNFFGSLTAWLFPDLNTRAVAMLRLLEIYIHYCIYVCKTDPRGTTKMLKSLLSKLSGNPVHLQVKRMPRKKRRGKALRGQCLDAKNGQPIRKANVEMVGGAGRSYGTYSATTIGYRTFTFEDLKAGRYGSLSFWQPVLPDRFSESRKIWGQNVHLCEQDFHRCDDST